MQRKNLLLAFGGLLLGVLLGLAVLWSSGAFSSVATNLTRQGPQVGQAAPGFSLADLDGSTGNMEQYKGRAVLINFWATWCGPCKAEMPLLERYYHKYAPDLVVLGINYEEGKVVAKQFTDENAISFPILLDEKGLTAASYQVRGFPSSFFVDKDGILRSAHIGQLDEALLANYLSTIGLKP